MNDILQQKLVRRGVPLKALSYGKIEPAAGGTVRQRVAIQQGIPTDKAKEIVKFIKDTKAKVQASIQGDIVRVTGRDRDTLAGHHRQTQGQRLWHQHGLHELPVELGARDLWHGDGLRTALTSDI